VVKGGPSERPHKADGGVESREGGFYGPQRL
jgi:hypothetical protein